MKNNREKAPIGIQIVKLIVLAALLWVCHLIGKATISEYPLHRKDYFSSTVFISAMLALAVAIYVKLVFLFGKKPRLLIIIGLTAVLFAGFAGTVYLVAPEQIEMAKLSVFGDRTVMNYDVESRTLTVSGTGPIPYMPDPNRDNIEYQDAETVIIEEGITGIGGWSFYRMSSLERVQLPEGLVFIGQSGFAYCSALKECVLPASLKSIGDFAFSGCTEWVPEAAEGSRFTIRDGFVMSGNGSTLQFCPEVTGIGKVTIPEGTRRVKAYAFTSLESLSTLVIPDGVTLEKSAVFGCDALVCVVANNVDLGNYRFAQSSNLSIVCGREGSSAVKWAEKNGYQVLNEMPDVITTPYEINRDKYANDPTQLLNDRWQELFKASALSLGDTDRFFELAADYGTFISSFTEDPVEELFNRVFRKTRTEQGTVVSYSNVFSPWTMDECLEECGTAPNGKVLPVIEMADGTRRVFADLIPFLPDSCRPTSLGEVEYMVVIRHSAAYSCSYTGGVNGYSGTMHAELRDLKTDELLLSREVTAKPPTTITRAVGSTGAECMMASNAEQARCLRALLDEFFGA